jgi:hypothetical protein
MTTAVKAITNTSTDKAGGIKLKVTVEIETTVDPQWIDYVVNCNDLFMRDYCGYWACGVEREADRGWLVFEEDDDREAPKKVPATVLKAWRAGEPLPKGWHRFDQEAAAKAWEHGVLRGGVDWYENGDANDYDAVMQLAVLGEIRYA